MDQGKRRGAFRSSLEAERIDLGNEPALSVDGESTGLVDRRRVSVQWFSGTILTGLCGAALMGGAVFAALDGETNFATVPERVEATLRGAGDRIKGYTIAVEALGRAENFDPQADPIVRVEAMRLRRALDEMVVDGIETTLPLFRALVREPAIIEGDYHIHWLEQYLAG